MRKVRFNRSLCLGVLIVAGFYLQATSSAQKLVTPGYLFNSDPTCREIDGRFYLFTTQDPFTTRFIIPNEFYKGMYAFHALSTTDFDNWIDHGSIVTGRDAIWNSGSALWDGDAGIPANGQSYAYAPFRINSANEQNYGDYEIGVFTSNNPIGPYKDALGAPMKQPDGKPLEGLSPTVIRDDNGTPFLIWGAGDTTKHEAMIAELKESMTQLAEMPRYLKVPTTDSCGNLEYFESPLLFHAGPHWYFTFVAYKENRGSGCDQKGSYVNYVVADNMFGPFSGPVRHLIYPAGDGNESVQQGICSYKGQLYLAYHVPYENLPNPHDHHRQVAVTKLTIDADGILQPIYPNRDAGVGMPGVSRLTLDAFAPRREAAEFYALANVIGQKGISGEYEMKMWDGGYLLFRHVDFGHGASGFRAEIRSENSSGGNNLIELHLDNLSGTLIGKLEIRNSGGQLKILATPLSSEIRGVHDLYLVARGTASGPDRRLFSLTWFSFLPRR